MNRLLIVLLFAFLLPVTARAQCAMPSGPPSEAGVIVFNTDHKVMQYCNGDKWIGLWGGGSRSMPTCSEGQIARWASGGWSCGDDVEIKGVVQQAFLAGPVAIPNETYTDMISLSVNKAGSYLIVGSMYMAAATGYTYHASRCLLYRNGTNIDESYFYAGIVTGGSTGSYAHKLMAHTALAAADTIKINCHQSANAASNGYALKIMLIPVKD